MKNLFKFILFLGAIIFVFTYKEDIRTLILDIIDPPIVFDVDDNKYSVDYDFMFVNEADDITPNNKQDIINIFFSIMNSGTKEITFSCIKEYETCVNDVVEISNDVILLASISDYVHPFYTYKTIQTTIVNDRNVKVLIEYNYSSEMISEINTKTDEILNELVNNNMSDYDKIKILHDYIINNTKYDEVSASSGTSEYNSSNAYGPLFEGYALCSGYSDLMSVYLNKLNIPNYRISTENHIWNFVFIDGKWLHLDLTWDDPISKTKDVLLHDFFLIDTNALFEQDKNEHNFNMDRYIEAKN